MPPGKRCRWQVLPRQKMPKATFSQPYICTEKDKLMPKLCMTRTINLSNTQFSYQLVFFIHIYGYIWLAEGCLWHLLPRQNLQWHLLPRQNLPSASFAQAKHARRYVLPGCMICLIQRLIMASL